MPKSKNRKGHKEKVQAYKKRVELEKKKAKEQFMKMYMEQMKNNPNMKRHVDGEFIENSEIDVDMGLDLDDSVIDVEAVEVETIEEKQ